MGLFVVCTLPCAVFFVAIPFTPAGLIRWTDPSEATVGGIGRTLQACSK